MYYMYVFPRPDKAALAISLPVLDSFNKVPRLLMNRKHNYVLLPALRTDSSLVHVRLGGGEKMMWYLARKQIQDDMAPNSHQW